MMSDILGILIGLVMTTLAIFVGIGCFFNFFN